VLPVAERVADLMSRMTVAEKIGQLGSFWAESAGPGEQVAPAPDDFGDPPPLEVCRAGHTEVRLPVVGLPHLIAAYSPAVHVPGHFKSPGAIRWFSWA
jgi:hypothetical protein